MALTRRAFLGRTAATGAGVALAGSFDTLFGAGSASAAADYSSPRVAGYGPLLPDPKQRLALPQGFSYKVVAESGVTTLDSGEPTPDRPDGTATFARKGTPGVTLVQNHELSAGAAFPVPHLPGLVYDPAVQGGTTNIVVDANGDRVREFVSLAGTDNNCAGGPTPWGTWLTCEETESRAGQAGRTVDHGYVFEVDPFDQSLNLNPKPIKALGRFPHEAVAVDPGRGRLYLTEDASGPNGLFYRWTPPSGTSTPLKKGQLKALSDTAGTLQALLARDSKGPVLDLSVATVPGTSYLVSWVTVPDRDAKTISTRKQFAYPGQKDGEGAAGPITRSRKLEGCWWGDGGVYFVASYARLSDGSAEPHEGQVWFYNPVNSRITLKYRFASSREENDISYDGPDNITVSPYGGVIIAEDGDGKQHLIGANPNGSTFTFAENQLPGDEEFTAPNFSPDGKILFANVQGPGHAFAITGPFRRF